MATNLCAECGTRLPRPEYKKHMEQVHGVSVMNDSDDEHAQPVAQAGEEGAGADDAPRPQRKPRGGGRGPRPAAGEASAEPAADDGSAPVDGAGPGPRRRRNRRAQPEDGKPEGDHKCSECERAFASLQGLFRHMTAKHPDSQATTDLAASVAPAPAPPRAGGRRGGRRPLAEGADGAAENGDEAAAAGTARAPRRRRPRKPRAPLDPEAKEDAAAASAAAAAALGGSLPPSEPRPERLVTLLRCKLCEIGFKSKNRARSHVSEAHPDSLPAKPADSTEAQAADGEAAEDVAKDAPHPADELLETVEVPARRAPRSQARRSRKPAAGGPDSNGNGEADPADDGAAPKPPPVRRGGRPPKASGQAAPVGAATDELAALGIVS